MGRNFSSIIGDAIGLIPPHYGELRDALIRVQKSAGFRAPEYEAMNWDDLCGCLNRHLEGKEPEPWMRKMHDLITGKAADAEA